MLLEDAAGLIQSAPEGVWLDAACGEGLLGKLTILKTKMVGIDIDFGSLVEAKRQRYKLLLQTTVTCLPFASNSLDGIITIETLEHVQNIRAALREFARCLKPGGMLVISMPSVTLRSLWRMLVSGRPVYCAGEQHVRELSAISIRKFNNKFKIFKWFENELKQSGFDIIRRRGTGYLLPMWPGRMAWLEHVMNLLYREQVNRMLTFIPIINRFPYYRFYVTRLSRRQSGSG